MKDSSPGPRDLEIAAGLRTAIHRLVKVLRKHTRNTEMLSLTERSTLGLLYQQERLLASELAQMEKVTTQSMSQVINHLYKMEFICKMPSPADGRKVYLSLTPAGRDRVEKNRQEKQEWLAQVISEKVGDKEKDTLMAAMEILTRLADEKE